MARELLELRALRDAVMARVIFNGCEVEFMADGRCVRVTMKLAAAIAAERARQEKP